MNGNSGRIVLFKANNMPVSLVAVLSLLPPAVVLWTRKRVASKILRGYMGVFERYIYIFVLKLVF
jgi:uncharacterized MnhB-related membrane protein